MNNPILLVCEGSSEENYIAQLNSFFVMRIPNAEYLFPIMLTVVNILSYVINIMRF